MSRKSGHADAVKIITALIDGLRIIHPRLNDGCTRALCALGGRIIPVLEDAARAIPATPHDQTLPGARH